MITNQIDANKYYIGFTNGIYDLQESTFVQDTKGIDKNLINMNFDYDYSVKDEGNKFDETHPKIICINSFMKQFYTNDEIRHYVMIFLTSCLLGDSDKKIYFWLKTGSNGKKTFAKWMYDVFGQYFSNVDSTILTRECGPALELSSDFVDKLEKKIIFVQEFHSDKIVNTGKMKEFTDSDILYSCGTESKSDSEFADRREKRIIDKPESDSDDIINTGKMRQLTGGDVICPRGMYEPTQEYSPLFKMIL
jgi:phage/plasmid-associated DNA primase